MHPHANPSAIVFWVRHPQSKAIEDDTYYGDASELSEKGTQQVPYIAKGIKQLKPDYILCSPAVRTVQILMAKDVFLCDRLLREDGLREWPRAEAMRGRLNSEPEVEQYLQDRLTRFMEGATDVPPGEESREKLVARLIGLETRFLTIAAASASVRKRKGGKPRATRIVAVSHGNLGRLFKSWALSQGDADEFVRDFGKSYNHTGINPGSFMTPLWYGRFFRDGSIGWNVEDAWDRHLPKRLRESEI